VAWLYRVVRNGALTVTRADRRRRHHEAVAAVRRPTSCMNPEGAALDAATALAALERLPSDQREAVVARLWGSLTFEQIGELSGVSAMTAHRRYVLGLEALRERLRVPCPKAAIPNRPHRRIPTNQPGVPGR
jgi:RNA polymerase sigma-70 factor (ECF subfamily)